MQIDQILIIISFFYVTFSWNTFNYVYVKNVGIRQRATALASIYKETCTTEPCEYYTEKMDEYFSDSSFDSIENEYASIASLSSPLGEYLEPKKLADN